MTRILVTGGAGFLGGHLVESLLRQGHDVVVMDSLWTGTLETVHRFQGQQEFRFIKQDVAQPFPSDLQVDQIYHLACPASPKQFPENPLGILETCYQGTKNALELAKKCDARILLASTSEVYGDSLVCPQPESYWGNVNSFGPRACYDEGKRVAEALAYAYRPQHKTSIRIVRIFNTYGPGLRADDGRVVSNFIDAALQGKDLIINGDGKSTRCFQFVSDTVRGMELLMNSDYDKPCNIGSDRETSIGKLATMVCERMAKRTGRKQVAVVFAAKLEDDPIRRQPDTSVAKSELGWTPIVSLEDGLDQSIEWYMSLEDTREHGNAALTNGVNGHR